MNLWYESTWYRTPFSRAISKKELRDKITDKLKIQSKSPTSDWETDYLDIVADVLQGDTLAPYMFIICLDYVLRMPIDIMKDNGFKLAKERSRRYPAQTIMDAHYANDYRQIHPPRLEPCCMVWNQQLVA